MSNTSAPTKVRHHKRQKSTPRDRDTEKLKSNSGKSRNVKHGKKLTATASAKKGFKVELPALKKKELQKAERLALKYLQGTDEKTGQLNALLKAFHQVTKPTNTWDEKALEKQVKGLLNNFVQYAAQKNGDLQKVEGGDIEEGLTTIDPAKADEYKQAIISVLEKATGGKVKDGGVEDIINLAVAAKKDPKTFFENPENATKLILSTTEKMKNFDFDKFGKAISKDSKASAEAAKGALDAIAPYLPNKGTMTKILGGVGIALGSTATGLIKGYVKNASGIALGSPWFGVLAFIIIGLIIDIVTQTKKNKSAQQQILLANTAHLSRV